MLLCYCGAVRISEIFYSIQGEGRLLGVPSVFIRTSGCNLRCRWCDTPYTSWQPEGTIWSIDNILGEVAKYPSRHVVITGGEPLLAAEIQTLAEQLKRRGAHITIETAATIFKPLDCDLISLSPKLANSTPWKKARGKFAAMHERRRLNIPVIQKFLDAHDYQLKFVVDGRQDFAEIGVILGQLKHRRSGAGVNHGAGDDKPGIIPQGDMDRRAMQTVRLLLHAAFAYSALRQPARNVIPRCVESRISNYKLHISKLAASLSYRAIHGLARAALLEGEDEIVCARTLAGVVSTGPVAGCSIGLFSNLATIAGARFFKTVTGKPLVKW